MKNWFHNFAFFKFNLCRYAVAAATEQQHAVDVIADVIAEGIATAATTAASDTSDDVHLDEVANAPPQLLEEQETATFNVVV
jgi:hypothetical protein